MKMLNDNTITNIHKFIFHTSEKEELPQSWSIVVICPIYKKDDPQIRNNNREIASLNVTYKVLSYYILDRIKPLAEEILGDYQGSFRPNRSTTDQMFSIIDNRKVVGI